MDVLLIFFWITFALSVEGRNVRFQQTPAPVFFEPSSRDLDVGIAIGVPEDDNSVDTNIGGNNGFLYGMSPTQNSGPMHLMVNQQGIPVPLYPGSVSTNPQPVPQYSQQFPQYSQQFQQNFPVPPYSPYFPSNMVSRNIQPNPLYLRSVQQDIPVQGFQQMPLYPQDYQQRIPFKPVEPVPFYPLQQSMPPQISGDMEQLPLYPIVERAKQPQVVFNQQGIPVMTSQPYGDRRVGAFRLRNDQGYQVTMEVPPSPPEAIGSGVLVMEMQATLYRPVQ